MNKSSVMAGLVPAIHALKRGAVIKTWMPATSAGMTSKSGAHRKVLVMAGLVPAIHALQTLRMPCGYVYIVSNKPNGILYVGVTSDLIRRVYEHRSGLIDGFTKRHGLKRLVWFKQCDDIRAAIQREKTMKHWPRAWKARLINAVNREWDDLYDELL